MQFHELHLDCVRHVFDRLTLRDLIHLRGVSHHWSVLVEEMCAERRVLRLFTNASRDCFRNKIDALNLHQDGRFRCTHRNSLLIGQKKRRKQSSLVESGTKPEDDQVVGYRFLAHLFPNISELIISDALQQLEGQLDKDLLYLLHQWSHRLTTLIIQGSKGLQIPESMHTEFWRLIGSEMTNLSELHLLDLEYNNEVPFDEQSKMSRVLAQLHSFTYDQYTGSLIKPLRHLGPELRSLRIGNHDELEDYGHLGKVNPAVTGAVTTLALAFHWIGTSVSTICAQFTRLQCLDISSMRNTVMRKESLIELLRKLAKLSRNLREIKLSWFNMLKEFDDREGELEWFVRSLPVLTSIQVLRLTDHFTDPLLEQTKLLKVIFPDSKQIRVEVVERKFFNDKIQPQLRIAFGDEVAIQFDAIQREGNFLITRRG